MSQVASWDWWSSLAGAIFGGSIGGASKKEKIARVGAILQPSSQPCPPGYYAAKYSGPNKNTVQCYVDPNYVAPAAAPEPEPALPTPVPEPSPATPTPATPPAPAPTPRTPQPADNPLVASPGAQDWDPRAYGAAFGGLTKVRGTLPKLPPLKIQKGGLPQTVPGSKVKRVGTTAYKAAEAIKDYKRQKVFRDPLIKPREMPRVDLPKGRTPVKITALGAAARAGNIIGLILTPGRLGNSDIYRDPYPIGQPVRSNRVAGNQSNRGVPISATSKARLERIGVIPRSAPNRTARKLPVQDVLEPFAITATRATVPTPVPASSPRPAPARTTAPRPVSSPTRTPRTPITIAKPSWMDLLRLIQRPRGGSTTVVLPLQLTTPTPTPTTTPTSQPKADPLTAPQADPLSSPAGPGYTPPTGGRTDNCDCKSKKRKPAKPRTVCYKGSYVEKAKGLTKTKREKISCQ